MKAKGNGDVPVCVGNLLRMWRGENPYERLKGMDPRLIDQPTLTVRPQVQQDAQWLIETYEPRAIIEKLTVEQSGDPSGRLIISAELKGEGVVTNG